MTSRVPLARNFAASKWKFVIAARQKITACAVEGSPKGTRNRRASSAIVRALSREGRAMSRTGASSSPASLRSADDPRTRDACRINT